MNLISKAYNELPAWGKIALWGGIVFLLVIIFRKLNAASKTDLPKNLVKPGNISEEFVKKDLSALVESIYTNFGPQSSSISNFLSLTLSERDEVIIKLVGLQDSELALLMGEYNKKYQSKGGTLISVLDAPWCKVTISLCSERDELVQRLRKLL